LCGSIIIDAGDAAHAVRARCAQFAAHRGLRRSALALLLAAGFAIRLTAAQQQVSWLHRTFPGSWPLAIATLSHDGATYLRQARNGLFTQDGPPQERWFARPFYRPPGASLYYDAALNLSGFGVTAFFLIQTAVAVASYALLFLVVRDWFPSWVAWAGLCLALAHPVLVFFDASLEDSVPALFFLALSLLAFSRYQRRSTAGLLVAAGLACALSVSMRPNFLVIPALLVPIIALRDRGWARPLLFLLPLAALLAFTARQNYVNGGGAFSGLLVATVGENLFWGNNEHPYYRIAFLPRKGDGSPAACLMETLKQRYGGRTDDETYLRAALGYLREHPLDAAAGVLRKALRHLSNWEIPRNLNFGYSQAGSPWFRHWYLPYGALAGLFLLGAAGALGERRPLAFLVVPVACAVVTEVLFFNASRYRSVGIPFMIPFALEGAAGLLGGLRRGGRARLVGPALLVLATTAAGALAVGESERRAYLSAEYHKAALVSLRWEQKWANLEAARALDPESIEVFDSVQYYLIVSGNAAQALALRSAGLPACVADDAVCRSVSERLLRRALDTLKESPAPAPRAGV